MGETKWHGENRHYVLYNLTFKDVLSHKTGFTQFDDGRCKGNGGTTHEGFKTRAESDAGPGACGPGNYVYSNANYALARILIASLSGYTNWGHAQVGAKVGEKFQDYMNSNVFRPIGIANVRYRPSSDAPLFYPWPNAGWRRGISTDFGDYSLKAGSAGVQLSTHELNIFARAMFDGPLLTSSLRRQIQTDKMGLTFEWTAYPGVKCYRHGGYLPQQQTSDDTWRYKAQLNSVLIGCTNGLRGFMVINGLNKQGGVDQNIRDTVRESIGASFSAP